MQQDQERPVHYGDIRVQADRRKGACLFWVVPDSESTRLRPAPCATLTRARPTRALAVAPGFNVPDFYEAFVRERREHVQFEADRRRRRLAADADRGGAPPTT